MRAAGASADRTVLGIGIAFIAFAILSSADALTKGLSARYSVFQIASIDGVVALLVLLPVLIRLDGASSLMPKRMGLVALRCAFGAGSLMLAFLSFSMMPMADAYAIAFLTPLAVTALSAPLLGERVGWRQWLAVVIGFLAVLVILRPDFGAMGAGESNLGQYAMLVSAALFAANMLMLRRIAKTESSASLLLVYFIMLFLIGLPLAISRWATPTPTDLGWMVLTGACSGIGNLALILAFRYARATIVSSFMYTQLIWGALFGMLFFEDLPDWITIGGAVVIMLCGIYTLTHESRTARAAEGQAG